MERNLKMLTRLESTIGFLYLEHASIERENYALVINKNGGSTAIPCASLASLVLGPGTSITHAAVTTLAECGTSIIWAGQDSQRFYASGIGKNRSSRHIQLQAKAWANQHERLRVVRDLYRLRFTEGLPKHLSIQQIRGREGVRVRDSYLKASGDFGVTWSGRRYSLKDWNQSDPINRGLSTGASVLYGICHGAICSMGFSPAIGFIHTGKALSFVYDIADVYKTEFLIPAAFQAVAESEMDIERRTRAILRQRIFGQKLMPRIARDLLGLFVDCTRQRQKRSPDPAFEDNVSAPANLWDPKGEIQGGTNYGDYDN